MTDTRKWTVRNVSPEIVRMLEEVREGCGATYGEMVREAVAFWYEALPYDDDDEDADKVGQDQAKTKLGSSDAAWQVNHQHSTQADSGEAVLLDNAFALVMALSDLA